MILHRTHRLRNPAPHLVAAARRPADRLRRHRRLRPRRRHAAALRRPQRPRAPRRHQQRRPGLGRQPGLADPRRRRDLRGLAAALRGVVLRLLPRDVRDPGGAHPAAGRLQVPLASARAARWRARWDWALFIGGFVPSLIFGVAVGNVLQGVPFRFDDDMHIFYDGTLLRPAQSLRPAVRAGVGGDAGDARRGLAACSRPTGRSRSGRARYGSIAALADDRAVSRWPACWLWLGVDGYRITSAVDADGPVEPAAQDGRRCRPAPGSPTTRPHPWTAGRAGARLRRRAGGAAARCVARRAVAGAAVPAALVDRRHHLDASGVSMFPFILPSSIDPRVQPDGVGRVVEPPDAVHHAGGRR